MTGIHGIFKQTLFNILALTMVMKGAGLLKQDGMFTQCDNSGNAILSERACYFQRALPWSIALV